MSLCFIAVYDVVSLFVVFPPPSRQAWLRLFCWRIGACRVAPHWHPVGSIAWGITIPGRIEHG